MPGSYPEFPKGEHLAARDRDPSTTTVRGRPPAAGRTTRSEQAAPTPSRQLDRQRLDASVTGFESALRGAPRARVWDGEKCCFNEGRLREVMVMRGFTADSLALAAGVSRGTIYNVLTGRTTRLATARHILEALAAAPPTILLSAVAAGL